jgi:hypothetical protein
LTRKSFLGGAPIRAISGCFALILACSLNSAEPGDRVKNQLKSDNYKVIWATAPIFDNGAVLEIGSGNGHGSTLRWVRFQPHKDGVDVLSIQFGEGRRPYASKWPPDRAPAAVDRTRLKPDAYVELLRDLAVVESAKLKPVERNMFTSSANDFWVSARLTTGKKTLLDLDWRATSAAGSSWTTPSRGPPSAWPGRRSTGPTSSVTR